MHPVQSRAILHTMGQVAAEALRYGLHEVLVLDRCEALGLVVNVERDGAASLALPAGCVTAS